MRTRWWSRVLLALVVGAGVTCQQAPGPIGGPPLLGLDAELVMPTRWAVGSHVGARIKVLEARDLRSLDPASGAHVRIEATVAGRARALWEGDANDAGIVTPRFVVPEVAVGALPIAIVAEKGGAARRLERSVDVTSDVRVLLSTDKPLYQPGQVIHLRALALRVADLHPVANETLTLEVEDGRGNRVFRRRPATSSHGIVSADFTLADEVNQGEYRIAVRRGEATIAEKTVAVQRYVLPKFKIEVEGLQPFYRPGDTVRGTIHANYFFGRAIQRGRVCVTAKTFDVEMHDLSTTGGTTNASGVHAFEVELPSVLAGTSLDRGDARIFLEVAVTDRAAHTERKTVSFPVTTAPLRVELLPESGKIVRAVQNEIYAVASTAEGRPAPNVQVRLSGVGGTPLEGRTDEAGIATFRLVPPAGGERYWQQGLPEGHPCLRSYGIGVQLHAEAPSGQAYDAQKCLPTERTAQGTILLRTDKVLLRAGESMRVTVLGGGMSDAFLDVIKGGQTVLTAVLDRGRDGRIEPYDLALPPELAGTLELHAYGLMADGNWARDGRIVQVAPPEGLRIAVEADRQTYRPGQDARIRFRVTDADGHPTAAALGVIMVDESVYALSDNQPGLERVFFMLEEEILRPRYSIYGPQGLTFAAVVLDENNQRIQQEAARALLAAASVPERQPAVLRDPRAERRRWDQQVVPRLLQTLFTHLQAHPDDLVRDGERWSWREDLLARWVADAAVTAQDLDDPLGRVLTLDDIALIDPELTVDRVALEAAHQQLWTLSQIVWRRAPRTERAPGQPNAIDQLVASGVLRPAALVDPWGGRFVWRRGNRFRHPDAPRGWELASPGPDGRLGNADDVFNGWKRIFRRNGKMQQVVEATPRLRDFAQREEERRERARMAKLRELWKQRAAQRPQDRRGARGRSASGDIGLGSLLQGGGGGYGGPSMARPSAPSAMPPAPARMMRMQAESATPDASARPVTRTATQPATARREGERAVARVREYFPETLLWRPQVVTDDQGRAEVALQVADSITTFRLTATANSREGALGSTTAGVRIFQDFFVDLDLPVALTQNDRVSVPVAIYNYLDRPQHVRIAVERGRWYELDGPEEHQLDLGPNEVTVRYFPIRARKVGEHRLGVFAYGDRMSDALRKPVTVEPDGRREEVSFSDRLGQEAEREVSIPDNAIEGSERVFVKLYPGVVSQVVENMDALLRVPYG